VVFDLTVAVEIGLIAACVTFIYRISSLSELLGADTHPVLEGQQGRVSAWRLYGALFFGAVKLVEAIEDALPQHCVVLDLKNVIYIDSSGADTLAALASTCRKKGVRLLVSGLMHQPLDIARRSGLLAQLGDGVYPDLAGALDAATQANAAATS
jgi:SulP family sulfate permease